MPKQLFQRPSHIKLGNPGKGNKFGGQNDWSRKKGKKVPAADKAASDSKPTEPNKKED